MNQTPDRLRFGPTLCFAVWVSVQVAASGAAGAERESDEAGTARAGVLVELFTSQGCSSCPPADRFLSELAESEDLEVIALSFHVDYWNYIGWTDPFSSETWSARQRAYGKRFGGNRIYTPQMVIDGHLEGVGSDRPAITGLIERAFSDSNRTDANRAEITLSATLEPAGSLRVEVGVENLSATHETKPLGIWVAIVESGLSTPVGRGENASKTLRNDRVVRHLEQLSKPGSAAEIPLRGEWRRDRLSVVAFLQDPQSLRVHAAAEVALGR